MNRICIFMMGVSLILGVACTDPEEIDADDMEQGLSTEISESPVPDEAASGNESAPGEDADPAPDEDMDPAPGEESGPDEVAPANRYSRCPDGNICFFTGFDGNGSMCNWNASNDPDWRDGAVRCSWAATHNVCSVSNRTSRRVQYYKAANYQRRVGSTLPGVAGNLACTYKLRSHKCQGLFCFAT